MSMAMTLKPNDILWCTSGFAETLVSLTFTGSVLWCEDRFASNYFWCLAIIVTWFTLGILLIHLSTIASPFIGQVFHNLKLDRNLFSGQQEIYLYSSLQVH